MFHVLYIEFYTLNSKALEAPLVNGCYHILCLVSKDACPDNYRWYLLIYHGAGCILLHIVHVGDGHVHPGRGENLTHHTAPQDNISHSFILYYVSAYTLSVATPTLCSAHTLHLL